MEDGVEGMYSRGGCVGQQGRVCGAKGEGSHVAPWGLEDSNGFFLCFSKVNETKKIFVRTTKELSKHNWQGLKMLLRASNVEVMLL